MSDTEPIIAGEHVEWWEELFSWWTEKDGESVRGIAVNVGMNDDDVWAITTRRLPPAPHEADGFVIPERDE